MILEAIKKGFGVASKSLGLVSVLFVFNLIFNLASIPFAVKPGTQPTAQLSAGVIIFSLVFIFISVFVQGGTLALVRDALKEGRMKLAKFASYGLKYYLRLLGLGILIILIIAVVAIFAALLIAGTAPLNNTIVTAIAVTVAIAVFIVVGLLYLIPLAMSPYALICDEIKVIESMKKSLKLVKTPFSRVFLLIALFVALILISLGIGFVIGFIVGMIAALLPAAIGQILMSIATSAVNGYLGVVMMTSFMVFYLGLTEKGKTVTV